jgi:type II secretory pathway component PulF
VSGTITAPSQRDVLTQLGQKALFPVTVQQASAGMMANVRGGTKRVKAQLMATTYSQLAGLLKSGVPLLRSLAILKEQSSNPTLKEVLSQIHHQVEEGATLAEAFARHPRVFSEMAISMVRAGGEGGFLEDALTRVADFTEKQEDLKNRTTGAMAYPVFLAVVGTLVVTVLIVFFVPKFEALFGRLRERGELPAVTDWLLLASSVMGRYGIFVLGAAGIGIYYLKKKLETEEGRLMRDRVMLKLPLAGNIFRSLAVSRFCRILGTLLSNGVPILRSLEISSSGTGNRVLSSAINDAAQNISEGQSLAGPLGASGHFPTTVVEMISIAEESNTLETVLTDISDSLDRQTWRQLDLMVRLLEPLMLLVLASVILVVVIALMLPVIRMATAM